MSTNTGSPFNFTLPQDTDLADFVNVFLKPQLTALNTYALHSTATQVLVNKSIADATDNSKTLGFNLAGTAAGLSTTLVASATGTSKTITLPNLTDTLVGRTTTDTLTNKTLTSPSITSPSITSPSITSPTISSGGLIVSAGNVGIGTSSPAYPLHVYGSANSSAIRAIVGNANSGSNAFAGLQVATDTTGDAGLFQNSVANVAYGGSGSLNVLQGGAYPLTLCTNNLVRLHITSAGAVGFGTTTPAPLTTTFLSNWSPMLVDGAYYGGGAYWNGSAFANRTPNQGGWVIRNNSGVFTVWTGAANVTADTAMAGFAERICITSTGAVGIGTSSPGSEFHLSRANAGGNLTAIFENSSAVSGSSTIVQAKANASNGYAGLALFSDSSDYIFFQKLNGTEDARITVAGSTVYFAVTSSTTEKMRINNTGVGIGGIGPSYSLHLAADSAAKPTSNTWTISSDARVKEVVGSYTRGVADIMALEPKRYRLNGAFGSVDDGRVHVSVIAQEAQATWPEMVGTYEHTDKDEDDVETVTELLNLNTNELQWALVNAIKELAQRVEALEVHG